MVGGVSQFAAFSWHWIVCFVPLVFVLPCLESFFIFPSQLPNVCFPQCFFLMMSLFSCTSHALSCLYSPHLGSPCEVLLNIRFVPKSEELVPSYISKALDIRRTRFSIYSAFTDSFKYVSSGPKQICAGECVRVWERAREREGGTNKGRTSTFA